MTTTAQANSAPHAAAITPFDFEGHAIRVVHDDAGVAWFNAGDVCAVLEYANARDAIATHVCREDVAKRDILTAGGSQPANYLNESGLYALVFGSTKESARRFKRWVTAEVLPALRRTGHYAMPGAVPAAPEPPPLLPGPDHRADQVVSAGRVFNAALRTAKVLRLPPARAVHAAFECALRHTGIDWKQELGVTDAETAPVRTSAMPGTVGMWYAQLDDGAIHGQRAMPGISRDWYELYELWCRSRGLPPEAINRFVTYLGRSGVRCQRKRVVMDGQLLYRTVVMLGMESPDSSQDGRTWLGDCCQQVRDILAQVRKPRAVVA